MTTLGESPIADVQRAADGLRAAIVRFARTGLPDSVNGIAWPPAYGDEPGQLVVSGAPHFERWDEAIAPKRKLLRQEMEAWQQVRRVRQSREDGWL